MVVEKEKKLIKLAVLFYMCSIIGYIYEMILCLIYNGKFLSHGILYGPWLPIYGTGSLLISCLSKYRKHPFVIFILSFFITGILEYICGFLLLKYLDMRLWDYRGWFLNINGFVCFLSAFCFGIGGLLITYVLSPFIKVILKKANKNLIKSILIGLTSIFSIDVLATIFKQLIK